MHVPLMAKKRTHVLIARRHFQTEQREMNIVTKTIQANVNYVRKPFLVTMLDLNILVSSHVIIVRSNVRNLLYLKVT